MPWKRVEPMEERLRFVVEAGFGVKSMSQLCRDYGISRKTGYKWLKRKEKFGLEGCRERSRAPGSCPHKIPEDVVQRLVALKRLYPEWGPKKLVVLLRDELPGRHVPCASTAGRILGEEGLVEKRSIKRKSSGRAKNNSFTVPKEANDVWGVDFKGWFYTGDHLACHPLTVTDLHSRYLIWCKGHNRQSLSQVKEDFEQIFIQFGLPKAIRVDNGTPFGSSGLGGLTHLSLQWMKLGIDVEFIHPGKPQQNGCHERMHRTLKLEVGLPPEENLFAQQKRFDDWQKQFNDLRPHEALGQRPPVKCYQPSQRIFCGYEPFSYPEYFDTRRVRRDGMFHWNGTLRFIGEAFRKERIGLVRDHENRWLVFAGSMLVGWQPEDKVRVEAIERWSGGR